MKKPMSNKSPAMQAFLKKIAPAGPNAVNEGCCPTCGASIYGFRDALSEREYEISGMCQECQDSVFGGK